MRLLAWIAAPAVLAASVASAAPCCDATLVRQSEWSTAAGNVKEMQADARGDVLGLPWQGVELRPSHDGGRTWEAASLGSERWSPWFAPVMDRAGRILAAAQDGAGARAACVSFDAGRTFLPPVIVGDEPGALMPALAIGRNGAMALAWTELRGLAADRLRVVASRDGITWSSAAILDEELAAHCDARVVVTASSIVVAWARHPPVSDFALLSSRSTDFGASWSPPAIVAADALDIAIVDVVVTPAGRVVVAWDRLDFSGNVEDRQVATSLDDGASWLAAETLATGMIEDSSRIVTSLDDRVHVAWDGPDPFAGSVATSESASAGWSIVPYAPGFHARRPFMAVAPDGILTIARGDGRDIAGCPWWCESTYLARSCDGGATWSERRLDDPGNADDSSMLSVTAAGSGRVHVTWSERAQASPTRIAYAAFDPLLPHASAVLRAGGDCSQPDEIVATTAADGTCVGATFQWFRDGLAIPGATSDRVVVDASDRDGAHEWICRIACPGAPCETWTDPVLVGPAAPAQAMQHQEIEGILRVARSSGGARLSWTDGMQGVVGHSVYEGSIDALTARRAYDHAALSCDVRGDGVAISMPAHDAYWLVTPANCRGEGGVGYDSLGHERPLPPSACGAMP